MRIVLQRVTKASVTINGKETKEIGQGLVVLVGFCPEDTQREVEALADKTVNLRIFSDQDDAMNLSLLDVEGELLVVSNFTLYANSRKGRRPSFSAAAPPKQAEALYQDFLAELRECGRPMITGEFAADMQVALVNDGPVTILLDSDEICPKL